MKTIISLAVLICLMPSTLFAEEFKIGANTIVVAGGVTASGVYFKNPGFLNRHDSYLLNDALLEFAPKNPDNEHIYFYTGVGVLQQQGIDRILAPIPPLDVEIQYAYLDVPLWKKRHLQIGQLNTLLGYESPVSYKNDQVLHGAMYAAQPNFYPGVRLLNQLASINTYVEVTNDPTIGDASWALGLSHNDDKTRFSVNYYVAVNQRSMLDLVYASRREQWHWGVNMDFHRLDSPNSQQDKAAFGVAFYTSTQKGRWEFPLRLEYLKDGNTGIYAFDKGYTLTLSPTYRLVDKQFIRFELVSARADATPFEDDNKNLKPNQLIVNLQAGMTF